MECVDEGADNNTDLLGALIMTATERRRAPRRVGAMTILALVCAIARPDSRPQEPQEQAPVFRTGVDLVRVDVSVTGRNDEPVDTLQTSDFEIKEAGMPERGETAQFVRLDGTRTSDTDESLEIRSPEHAAVEAAREDVRLFAIFLDDYHVDKDQGLTLRVRRALKDFVRQFGANDLIAVMDPLTPLSHLRFTRSRDELLARMDGFEGRRHQTMPVRSVLEEAQLTQRNVWELRGGVTLSALEALVTHLGGLRDGRKSILLVSQGPDLGRINSGNEERLNAVVRSANRSNVTIHAFDPRPLGSAEVGGADAIARLTRDTGGRAIVNSNDPSSRLTQTITDASAYYLLGYAPARTAADGRFHRIEVKGNRGSLRVMARRGYWAPSEAEMNPAPPPRPPEPGFAEALAALVGPKEGREVDVWIGASRGSSGLTRMTVSWEPTGRTRERNAVQLEIEPLTGRRMAALPAAPSAASEPVTVDASAAAAFELAPGTAVVFRFTAKARNGSVVDRWDRQVEVPIFSGTRLELGTPRFLRARSAFEVRAIEAGQDPTPAASRRFRRSDRVLIEWNWYAVGDDVPSIAAWLLNARGDPLLELSVSEVTSDRARLSLPLSSLALGTYVIRLEARAGQHQVEQRWAFQIVP